MSDGAQDLECVVGELMRDNEALRAENEKLQRRIHLFKNTRNEQVFEKLMQAHEEIEKLRAALKDCEKEMRSIVSYIRYEGKWAYDSGILLDMLRKADAAADALKETE